MLLLVSAAGLLVLARRVLWVSLPRTRGVLETAGVSAAVTVTRDSFGVPHIDAESMEDAAFAAGLVHGQDRLWQMEMTRRVAAGRVSELVGPDGLAIDRFMRRLGLARVAASEERQAGAEVCQMLEAYAAGVNQAIASARALPLEFRLLHATPEPWRPVDSLLAWKLLSLGLSLNWDMELQRLDLLRQVGPERAAQLEIVYPQANPTILAGTAHAAHGEQRDRVASMFLEAARWIPGSGGASNAWVVAPTRSSTGRPILCNDPHLPPSVPSVWYAAHVRAGDDFESTGVTMPGMPFVLIGHNRRVAWGFTNSFADCQDLVIEEFNAPSAERYRTERGFERTRVTREIIHVRGASDEVEEVVTTRHGPIVERFADAVRDVWRGLALQWTALTPGGAMESLLRLQRASDWQSFRDAFAPLDAPSQNVVYADVEGHIGYLLCGRVPVRKREPSLVPLPGWNGDALWSGFLTQDQMPCMLDPESGVIITANNRITGSDFPRYIGTDYMNGYRALRIAELLGDDTVDIGSMRPMQMDIVSPPARTVAKLLASMSFESPAAEGARQRLVAWDGTMAQDLAEPTLYEAFMARLAEHALRPSCGDAWRTLAGFDREQPVFEYPGNLVGRLTPSLLDRWERNDAALLGGQTWEDVASRALSDAWSDLRTRYGAGTWRWRWGRVHALRLEHLIGRRRPLHLLFNAGTLRIGGSADTVMATAHVPGQSLATRVFAPSWRQVIDVGAWDECTGVHMPGQSGQPGTRMYRNLRRRWQRNEQFPLAWSAQSVRRNERRRLVVRPAALR